MHKIRKKKILGLITSIIAVIMVASTLTGSIWTGLLSRLIVQDRYFDQVDTSLINPNASQEAKELMAYLGSIYGEYTLSGQYINEYESFHSPTYQVDPSDPNSPYTVFKINELRAVHSVTGKYPALLGLDVSGTECGNPCYSVEQAIEWHNAGGIVTMCWHWLVDNKDGKERAFYTDQTDFDLAAALENKDSEQYKGLIADIDKVSESLKPLQEAGVPVLWRPLHEASGGWFWWGASGIRAYKELWNILYDRMTNYHGLNNLIWVYNGQSPFWYVGDNKCDIIGDDPYYPNNSRFAYILDSANKWHFWATYLTSNKKMIAMTENDFVPNINKAYAKNARWLTFCTWCREFVCEMDGISTTPNYGSPYTTAKELKAAYDNQHVLTLDETAAAGIYSSAH
ncbi:MAG: hypothetical protein KH282_09490 [Clostridiales bacterium]|nr:hypothetical protein [Clostridiales bacterium]